MAEWQQILKIGTSPDPASVANGGFAPLCGAAAIPMAALKAPVAKKRGATKRTQMTRIRVSK